jgi:hypothetical protein
VRAARATALAALTAACAGAPPEPAAEAPAPSFAPPAGCRLLATVQQQGCATAQVTACAGDPSERVTHVFVDGAPVEVVTTRGALETRIERAGGAAMVIDRDARDPLAASGPVEARALLRRPDGTVAAAVRERFAPAGPVSLGGRPLRWLERETEFERDGRVRAVSGDLFYDAALRAPVGHVIRGPEGATDRAPASIALPGEPGFGSLTPATPCVA